MLCFELHLALFRFSVIFLLLFLEREVSLGLAKIPVRDQRSTFLYGVTKLVSNTVSRQHLEGTVSSGDSVKQSQSHIETKS